MRFEVSRPKERVNKMATQQLDVSSGVPLYRQIMDILRKEITSGSLEALEPMTEARLIERFGVSLAPIRQALKELSIEGLVYRKQGKGTFPVTSVNVDRPADLKPGDLYRYLVERGLHPKSNVFGIERIEAPASVAQKLGLGAGEKVLHFSRLITCDDLPFAENDIFIKSPEGFFPGEAELENGGSALKLLEDQFGIQLERAEHEAWATSASPEHAAVMQVDVGSPLLVIDTLFFQRGGNPTGWRTAIHRPDEFKYHFITGA